MSSRMDLTNLPAEVLHSVLSLLSFTDLKSCALCCHRLSELATAARLWQDFPCDGFAMSRQGMEHYLKVLRLPRYATAASHPDTC